MKYVLDVAPSSRDINEVRAGLIKHNTPFLDGLTKQQVGYTDLPLDIFIGCHTIHTLIGGDMLRWRIK